MTPAFSEPDPADSRARALPAVQVDLGPQPGKIDRANPPAAPLIPFFTAQIMSNSRDALSYRYRGQGLRELRRFDEAIDDFTTAIRLRPDDAGPRLDQGTLSGLVKRIARDDRAGGRVVRTADQCGSEQSSRRAAMPEHGSWRTVRKRLATPSEHSNWPAAPWSWSRARSRTGRRWESLSTAQAGTRGASQR